MSSIPEGTILVDSTELLTKLDKAIGILKEAPQNTAAAHNFSDSNREIVTAAGKIHAPLRDHLNLTHQLGAQAIDTNLNVTASNQVIQQLDETINKFKNLLKEQKESGVPPEMAPYHQIVDGTLKINKACAFVTGEVESILKEVNSVHAKLWKSQVQEVNSELESILRHANKVHLHLKEHLTEVHAGEESCTSEDCANPLAGMKNQDPFEAVSEATIVLEKLRELVKDHMDVHA